MRPKWTGTWEPALCPRLLRTWPQPRPQAPVTPRPCYPAPRARASSSSDSVTEHQPQATTSPVDTDGHSRDRQRFTHPPHRRGDQGSAGRRVLDEVTGPVDCANRVQTQDLCDPGGATLRPCAPRLSRVRAPTWGPAGADPAPSPSAPCTGRATADAEPAHPPSASPGPASWVAPP